MQDASAYCTALVREADRDRYLATLFAPAEKRDALAALYAFNIEITRVREAAREPLAGEIRLQWWSDVLHGERREEASANPVAAALQTTVERHGLAAGRLNDLVEAHRFDLYDEPMAALADLEAYAAKTSSALIGLAAQILGADAEAAAAPAGIAYAVAGLLRAFPQHAARGQIYVPSEILDRHGAAVNDIFAGRPSPGLDRALAELRAVARRHLADAQQRLRALPPQALPAFLPLALVKPLLRRLERNDAFAPADLAPWRRPWLIWRAAHSPGRIAG
jgi:phytoene synthase